MITDKNDHFQKQKTEQSLVGRLRVEWRVVILLESVNKRKFSKDEGLLHTPINMITRDSSLSLSLSLVVLVCFISKSKCEIFQSNQKTSFSFQNKMKNN